MNNQYLKRMKEYLKDDYNAYLKSLDDKPYRSIRLNNIEYDTFIKNIDMSLTKINYDLDGYYLNNDKRYGNHPYHHLGAFYFQEPSAMMPVNLYDFQGNEKVLDLCASPGGKSSQILKRIPNGILVTNEIDKKRSQILFSNLERLGFSNAIITNNKPSELEKKFKGFFDVVLVDAPCSGEGMMRKQKDIQDSWSLDNVLLCSNRDKDIIDSADKMLKKGGKLIYSTCTFAKEEDCDIVEYIISKKYHLLNVKENLKEETYPGFLKNTRRFYPMKKGEGQFMALLEKENIEDGYTKTIKYKNDSDISIIKKFFKENIDVTFPKVVKYGNRFYANCSNYDVSSLNVLNFGVELGIVKNKIFKPSHHLFKVYGEKFYNKVELNVNSDLVRHYLKGEEIVYECSNGYGVIIIDGLVLGGFKAVKNHLHNHYPKGLRNMNLDYD